NARAAAASRREYAKGARESAWRGVAISGEELAEETSVVGSGGDVNPTLQPRGFFIVEAPDLPSAERLASTCPPLRHGVRIVIRRIAGCGAARRARGTVAQNR